jgi:HlyD family secretion protein
MRRLVYLISILAFGLIACSNGDNDKYIEESGTIEMVDIIVSAKSAGEVIKILKDEGDRVNQGDTILIIDDESQQLQLNQAVAAQQAAESQLQLLVAGARKEDIKQAIEMVSQAEINMNSAAADRSRFEKLFGERAITRKQFDDADARYKVALSQYNAAKANLNKVENFARKEDLSTLKARVNQAIAVTEIIKKGINDCYVTSPINGQIVKSFLEPGETASPMSSLVKIIDLSSAELMVYVSETDLGKIKLGQKTEIFTDTFKDRAYEGEVVYISPEAEFTPKNIQTKDERTKLVFAVKIRVPNPDFELKSGMPADARVLIN